MNIGNNGKVLSGATRELWRKWLETKYYWQDRKSGEFEERFLTELTTAVERTGPALERLDKLVHAIKEQCE